MESITFGCRDGCGFPTTLKGFDGVRSMVVITDGADNCISEDAVTNPLGLTAEKLIEKHFNASGITVNVIAFRVDADEQNETRDRNSNPLSD